MQMKRVLMGIVWFVVLYIGSCMAIGMGVGFVAGTHDPAHAKEAGKVAAQKTLQPYLPYLLGGSLLLAFAGTATGILPGTRKRKPA
jgi:hypothetical protein